MEFALVVPIIALVLLSVVDLSRVFTAVVTVESAVREAAEYGAWRSDYWSELGEPFTTRELTEQAMRERACTTSANLLDFQGTTQDCTNPKVTAIELIGIPANTCAEADRSQGPCWVRVEMEYTHKLIAPFGFQFLGTRFGLPDSVTFRRESVFAISDFTTDYPSDQT